MEKRRGGGSPRTYTRILQSVCLSFSARVRVSYVDLLYMRGWQAWILFAAGDEVDELKTRRLIYGNFVSDGGWPGEAE